MNKTLRANATKGIVLAACVFSAGCTTHPVTHAHADNHTHTLPAGSNEMLRATLSNNPELEIILSDVLIPAGQTVPKHYHPGEEFLYLIEGTAIHREEGKPDLELKAGDTYVIPPRAVHNPMGGPNGARAIVFRVHDKGNPERILVE